MDGTPTFSDVLGEGVEPGNGEMVNCSVFKNFVS